MKQNFKADLAFGQKAEQVILSKFVDLSPLDGRMGDFIHKSGIRGELKADRYTSGNFFFEHFSHHKKQTPGGPFKAKEDGCAWFLYLFTSNGALYLFDTETLINHLLTHKDTLRYHLVSKSNASGFIVPIKSIEHLCLSLEVLGDCA